MPVVEPYAISEPLSTAGKVNLNAQVLPFIHLTRTTALRGALRPIFISALREDLSNGDWKNRDFNSPIPDTIRYGIDVDETVKNIEGKWASSSSITGNIFKSATEISEIKLVPQGRSAANSDAWWSDKRLTSDTLREQPYTALLSRVTTKSNTFTVHYRVQALRQSPRAGRNWAEWDEEKDQIVGEYRGSTTIERFLDPNATNIPDYTTVSLSGNYDPIDKFYRWRVLSQKQFAP